LLSFSMAVPLVTFLLYRGIEELIAFVLELRRRGGADTGRVRAAQWVETLAGKVAAPAADAPGPGAAQQS
jgi:hypothetical protein